jgi:DNA-binding XRE family transcriptional regulator
MYVLLSKLNHRSSTICNYFLGTNPNVVILLIWLYNSPMTKQQLIQLAGSQAELARLLKISRSAVCQWEAVPELQLRRLKDLRPQWFTQEKT